MIMAVADRRSLPYKISYYAGTASSILACLGLMSGGRGHHDGLIILLFSASVLCALVDLLLYFYLVFDGAKLPKDPLLFCLPIAGILLFLGAAYFLLRGVLVGHG